MRRAFEILIVLIVLAALANLVRIAWPFFVVVAVGGLAIGVVVLIRSRRLLKEFERRHGAEGVRILVYTSDSPVWGTRIRDHWLPRLGSVARVVNRSSPEYARGELSFERRLLDFFRSGNEHTPAALLVGWRQAPRVLQFFSDFRDFKHGKTDPLARKEARLFEWADRLAR